jgi:drug/metabolite transporter (DMT)-like permease
MHVGDRPLKALGFMLLAQLFFSFNILLLRVTEEFERLGGATDFKLSPWEPMLYRSLPMVLWCLHGLWRRPGETLTMREWTWIGARGTAGVLSLTAYYYGVLHVPLGIASLMSNCSPLYVALLAVLFTKERLTRLGSWSLFCGFLGVGLVALSARASGGSMAPLDLLIASLSGPLSALAYLSIRQLKKVRNEQIMLSLGVTGLILASVMLAIKGAQLPTQIWAQLALVASVPPALAAQECLTRAYRNAPASKVAPLQYMGPLFATLLAWLFLNENIPLLAQGGMALVLMFGMILPYIDAKRAAERLES